MKIKLEYDSPEERQEVLTAVGWQVFLKRQVSDVDLPAILAEVELTALTQIEGFFKTALVRANARLPRKKEEGEVVKTTSELTAAITSEVGIKG